MYLRDLDYFIEMLKSVGKVGEDNYLFTADIVAINPNIDREEALVALIISFKTNLVQYNPNLPIKLLVRVL